MTTPTSPSPEWPAGIGRIGPPGEERMAVRLDGTVFVPPDSSIVVGPEFLADHGPERMIEAARSGALPEFDPADVRVGAPVVGTGKIVCIGLNYRRHAAETGAEAPAEPVVFFKDPSCVVGPDDTLLIPRKSVKTDWEVELAVVIGTTARYLESPADSRRHVAGFTISNDVSEREFQLERGGQWDKGKSCETFNPLGPWLVPASEVPDPQALDMRLWVNDELRQAESTADMIFDVDHVIWYLSQFMVLRPGDIVNTGTPAGVALGLPGTPYLRDGDVVELEISGLGRQRQVCRQA
jgi:2-keto-4-pentenoate hydratase/2-oxohepta-3-ene-1,7-dioic acid hydratase in catechol pathway